MSALLAMQIDVLAGMSRKLRLRERKAFNQAQTLRIHARLADAGVPKTQLERILKRARRRTVRMILGSGGSDGVTVKVPMPTPEPEWLTTADAMAQAIHMARTVYLRRELRAGYLAYGFLRGLDLDAMEAKGREPIPFDRIEAILQRYGHLDDPSVSNSFTAWKADAIMSGTHPKGTDDPKRIAERVENEAKFGLRLSL